jgi:DNA-binding response OmpR family regulator
MAEGIKILVVDDDPYVCQSLMTLLQEEGYAVVTAADGAEALRRVYGEKPDLVILDVTMPDLDGWEVCKRVREMTDTPVLMLTARGQVRDRVKGLDLGADDYLLKPVAAQELLARVRAALRRSRLAPVETGRKRLSLDGGRVVIDLEAQGVWVEGERLQLRPLEHHLLFYLARNAGRLLTYDQIIEAVWSNQYAGDRPSLKLYIWRLRRKIERDLAHPRCILTERGLGYRLARPE